MRFNLLIWQVVTAITALQLYGHTSSGWTLIVAGLAGFAAIMNLIQLTAERT
jgi:hypothetical protein